MKINNNTTVIICEEPIYNMPLNSQSEPHTVCGLAVLGLQFWSGGLFDMKTLERTKEKH